MKYSYYRTLLTGGLICTLFSGKIVAQGIFQTKLNGGGNANLAATWTMISGSDADGVPDSNDDITILSGDKVKINAAQTVNNIDIQSSGVTPGSLVFNAAFTFTVNGNITFTYTSGTKPLFSIDNGTTIVNGSNCILKGNFVNASNGTVEMWKTGATTGGQIDYNSTSPTTQTIVAADYGTLRLSGSGNKIMASSGTIAIYKSSTTCFQNATTGSITTTGSTIEFACAGAQTIPNFNYYNLKCSGSGNRTVASASVNIAHDYTPGTTNTFVMTGSQINFNGTTCSIIGSGAVFNNLTINAGCTLTAPASTSVQMNAIFANNGTSFVHNNSTFIFTTASCQINGTTTTTFYNITLNTSATVTLNKSVNIEGLLSFGASSTFNANSKTVTLKSTSTSSGSIGNLTGATLSNATSVILERFIPGWLTGWVLLGTSTPSRTIADWQDDFATSGFVGATGTAGNNSFVSIYRYDETQAGDRDATAKYIAATNVTNTITVGKGYWCYVGDGPTTTSNITVDMPATTITSGNQNVAVTYTNNNPGAPTNDGWNLIANPYPSAIDFSSLYTANSAKMNDYYQVYNADIGDYAYYDISDGTGVPDVSAGGVDLNISSSRGFYVQTLAAIAPSTTLSFTESMKLASANTEIFVRTAQPHNTNATSLFRINVANGTRSNDCAIRFLSTANDNNDVTDKIKFKTKQNGVKDMLIYSSFNGTDYSLNSMGLLQHSLVIPISVKVGKTDSYTLSSTNINTVIAAEHCVRLHDKYTDTFVNIRNENYTCVIDDTTSQARFELIIDYNANAPVVVNTINPNCSKSLGDVEVKTSLTNYSLSVISNDKTVVSSQTHLKGNTVVEGLDAGEYDLALTNNTCVAINKLVQVKPSYIPTAAFTVLTSNDGNNIAVTNTSKAATKYVWDFGDGVVSTEKEPVHTYIKPGSYTITLAVGNEECGVNYNSAYRSVYIDANSSAVNEPIASYNCLYTNNSVAITTLTKFSKNASVNITTMLGQVIATQKLAPTNNCQVSIPVLPTQPLIVTVFDGDKKYSQIVTNRN